MTQDGADREHRRDHGDDHDHDRAAHVHAPASFGAAFAVGIALNLGFVGVEAAYGFLANSVALLADAGHNLGDVLGLGAAWLASELTKRAPSGRFTYGLRGSSILAALFNAVFLMLTVRRERSPRRVRAADSGPRVRSRRRSGGRRRR